MSKTRILLLRTNRVDPDPRVEKEVNSLLKDNNLSIEVLAWDRGDNYEYRKEYLHLANGDAIIHRIGVKAGWGVGLKKNATAFVKYTWKTFRWLFSHQKDYDIIHACDLHTIIPSIIPIKIFHKKFVYDIYDFFSDTAHGNSLVLKLSKSLETKVINEADATIVCSEKRIEQIRPAKPKRLYVIHNAPSLSQVNIQKRDCNICKSSNTRPKVVYVGNLVEDRCIDLIIESARKCPDIEFHIGGIGKLEYYVQNASSEMTNLFYYGRMDYKDVLALEIECDIMIALYDQNVPNHRFAAPNKFYEAIAMGKPLVMLHNTGVDGFIDEYDLGVTVEQTPEGVVTGLNQLIERRNDWTEMSLRAKNLYYTNFCWEIMEQRLYDMYSDIVGVNKDEKCCSSNSEFQ